MAGYWERAIRSYNEGDYNIWQWYLFPPFSHITLAWFFKVLNYVGLFHKKLEIVLMMNTVLSTFGVWFVYLIARKLDSSKNYALLVAFIYAFFFPLIYFNAFILTENISLFVFLLSIVLLLYLDKSLTMNLFAIGTLLAFSIAIRPSFGVSGAIFAIYIWFYVSGGFFKKLQSVFSFSLAFFIFLLLVSINNFHISKGNLRSLSANGGANLYATLCDVHRIEVRDSNGIYFWIMPPINQTKPENITLKTDVPYYKQDFYKEKALECFKNNDHFWKDNFMRFQYFYHDALFPNFENAKYSRVLIPLFSSIALFFTLLLLFSPLIFFIKESKKGNVLFLFGIIVSQLIVYYFFNVEQRYLYGFFFAILLLSLLTMLILIRHFSILKRPFFMGLLVYSVVYSIVYILFIYSAIGTKNITMHILQNNTNVHSLYQSRDVTVKTNDKINTINFKTTDKLEHNNLGEYPYSKNFFIDFFTKMTLSKDAKVKFMVVSDDGFSLWIDDEKMMDFPENRPIRKSQKTVILKANSYTMKLSYFQGLGPLGLRAYYFIDGNRYLFGENSPKVTFEQIEDVNNRK